MPRNMRRKEHNKAAKAKRDFALERIELGQRSEERVAAAGPTSHAVKSNPDADLIEAFLKKRKIDNDPEKYGADDPPRPSDFGPGGLLENLRVRALMTPKCESPIEIDLGAALIQQADGRFEVVPQYEVDRFRFDFGITAAGELLALVECDGAEFHSSEAQIANDARKDAAGAALGVPVMRFSGKEIHRNPQACAGHVIWRIFGHP